MQQTVKIYSNPNRTVDVDFYRDDRRQFILTFEDLGDAHIVAEMWKGGAGQGQIALHIHENKVKTV